MLQGNIPRHGSITPEPCPLLQNIFPDIIYFNVASVKDRFIEIEVFEGHMYVYIKR